MNNEEKDKVYGGGFLVARQFFESELWLRKPASWTKIWIYILGRVNHADNKLYKRGSGFFMFSKEKELIGPDVTPDKIKKFIKFAKTAHMIDTRRSTRGIEIKVLMYNKYQTLNNYEGTALSTKKALEKHQRSTPINKNEKNESTLLGATAPEGTAPPMSGGPTQSDPQGSDGLSTIPAEEPFDWPAYLDSMFKKNQKHIRVIAQYFDMKEIEMPNAKAASSEIGFWNKDATYIAQFPGEKIMAAFDMVSNDEFLKGKWTLKTVRKYIANI